MAFDMVTEAEEIQVAITERNPAADLMKAVMRAEYKASQQEIAWLNRLLVEGAEADLYVQAHVSATAWQTNKKEKNDEAKINTNDLTVSQSSHVFDCHENAAEIADGS